MSSLIIGTRGSRLALAQAEIVRDLLHKVYPTLEAEVKVIRTKGDKFQDMSLSASGGKGVFTKELEDAILDRQIHFAVHSLKDLPTELPDGLEIGAVPSREDPRDVLIAKKPYSLKDLPENACIGTSSVRRRAQLLFKRPDLRIEEIRGNVETRLRKLRETQNLDALVLAVAGLTRLGLEKKMDGLYLHYFSSDEMIPAVGQGAIACELRKGDPDVHKILQGIQDADANDCIIAERTFLAALGGGCHVPYAASATINGDKIHMIGAKLTPDGKDCRRAEIAGDRKYPAALGEQVVKKVLS